MHLKMAAAAQYVLLEHNSDVIFLNELKFLKQRYSLMLSMYVYICVQKKSVLLRGLILLWV